MPHAFPIATVHTTSTDAMQNIFTPHPQEMHEKDKLECGVANWLCVRIPVAFILFRGFYQTR